jgi:hypothetical protein
MVALSIRFEMPEADETGQTLEETRMSPKTVVLFDGAFADGSSRRKLIPLLEAKGLRAVVVHNPLKSLNRDVGATRRHVPSDPD